MTKLEASVWEYLIKYSENNGHDFGILEEAQKECVKETGVDPKAFGGVITSLQAKGKVSDVVYVPEVKLTQYVLPEYSEAYQQEQEVSK